VEGEINRWGIAQQVVAGGVRVVGTGGGGYCCRVDGTRRG